MEEVVQGRVERPLNVIVKVSAHGNQKQISIESQLLIMNNLLQPLTLKFVIRTLNDSAAKLKQDKLKSYFSRK